jgi:hypothetical protein
MHSAEVKGRALSLSQPKYLSLECVCSKGSRVCKRSICRRVFERLEGMQEIDILNAADQGALYVKFVVQRSFVIVHAEAC